MASELYAQHNEEKTYFDQEKKRGVLWFKRNLFYFLLNFKFLFKVFAVTVFFTMLKFAVLIAKFALKPEIQENGEN